MRYALLILIVVFAAGCAEIGEKKRDFIAEGYHRELQWIRASRPHARELLPESLADKDVTLLAQFMTYRADLRCKVLAKYPKAAEAIGCIVPPGSLTDAELTRRIQFLVYMADKECEIIAKFPEVAEAVGCVVPEVPVTIAPL